MPANTYHQRPGAGVNDLIDEIDAYLATTTAAAEESSHEHRRPDSAGTMFVDFDEQGEMKVSYRNRQQEATTPTVALQSPPRAAPRQQWAPSFPVQSPPRAPRQQPVQSPPRASRRQPSVAETALPTTHSSMRMRMQRREDGTMAVAGIDTETGFEYDYDGQTMYIHRNRDRDSDSTVFSEYYDIPAQDYATGLIDNMLGQPRVKKPSSDKKPRDKKRHDTVGIFIKKVFGKMDGKGWLKIFHKEKSPARKVKDMPAMKKYDSMIPQPLNATNKTSPPRRQVAAPAAIARVTPSRSRRPATENSLFVPPKDTPKPNAYARAPELSKPSGPSRTSPAAASRDTKALTRRPVASPARRHVASPTRPPVASPTRRPVPGTQGQSVSGWMYGN